MTVKSLLVKIGSDVRGMEAGFKKADGLIKQNAATFKKAGKNMAIAGGAILGVMTGVVKAYADFDQKLNESTAIMGDVSDAMKGKMAEAAKEMSENSTFAAAELAEAYFFLASAGMDAEQSIAALPVVSKFAQAGAFDLANATDLLTDAQSALGLSSKDAAENQENMARVSDVLVMANTLANASVQQFSEALTNKAGPAIRAYGVELEEGGAVLAAFADQGIKGSMAGEQYAIVLRDLQKAAILNKGAFDQAGIAVYDANGNLNNMGDIVEGLEGHLGDMSAEQKKSTLTMLGFQERSQGALLTLLGTSEKIKEYEKNLRSAGGTTERVAKKQLKSLTNQLILAKNSIVNTAISLGEQLAPMVVEIAGKIKETVKKIRDWIKEHPELTKGIALTAVKVGALLVVLGPIVMMLPGLVTGFSLLGGAITAMTGPVGLAALAIAGIVLLIKDMRDTLREAKKEMQDFADESTVFADVAKNFQKLWVAARQEGGKTLEQFDELMTRFGGNWDKILKQIVHDPKFAILKSLLLDIANGVREVDLSAKDLSITLPKSFEGVEEGGEKTVKAFKEVIALLETSLHPALRRISGVTKEVVLATMADIALLKEDIMNLSAIFPEELGPSVINAFDVLKNAVDVGGMQIREFLDNTKKHWEETFDKIAEFMTELINGLDAIFAQAYTNNMIRIDNEEKRRLEAINNTYDATIEANRKLLEAEQEKTKEVFSQIDKQYEKKRQRILDNVTDEGKRAQKLADLEEWYQSELEVARIEREQAEKETADALEAIEFAKNEALRIASEELEEKRSAARRTAAKQEKAVALLAAIVNTAAAVVKALPNIPLAIAVGILGAIQIALIRSQPIPLAKGGLVTGRTEAVIGEAGPEVVIPLDKIGQMIPAFGGGAVFKQYNYFYGDINNVGDVDEISSRLAEKTRRSLERGT